MVLIAQVAIGDLIFLSFFYLVVRLEYHAMSDLEIFWYRICRNGLRSSKRKCPYRLLPSGGVFGIAWAILYFCYAISFYIVWLFLWYDIAEIDTLTDDHQKQFHMIQACFIILFVSIIANKMWTGLFFRSKQYLVSLLLIVFMFITVVPVIVMFYYLEFYWSASLLVPYALWLGFAFYLNFVFYKEKQYVDSLWNNLVEKNPELTIYNKDKDIPKRYSNLTKKQQPEKSQQSPPYGQQQ
jgi:tryptophan-rich sensory protein